MMRAFTGMNKLCLLQLADAHYITIRTKRHIFLSFYEYSIKKQRAGHDWEKDFCADKSVFVVARCAVMWVGKKSERQD